MAKYRVTVKYGNPGEYKHNSQTFTVEAGSESTAMQLAVSKFKDGLNNAHQAEVAVRQFSNNGISRAAS